MHNDRPDTLTRLFRRPRGIAVFMAALILLSVSILALSTMTRISEASQLAGQTLEARRLAIISDAAMRVALAQITEQFIAAGGSPDIIYVNKTNTSADTDKFRLLEDKTGTPAVPLFGYRAKATLLLVGDGATVIPGIEFPVSNRNSCYHMLVDIVDILPGVIQNDTGVPEGYSGYYFGQMKSIGITTCLRKRNT